MISVNVDLTKATESEKEAFLTLPHVAGAIDSLAHVECKGLNVSLRVDDVQSVSVAANDVYSEQSDSLR